VNAAGRASLPSGLPPVGTRWRIAATLLLALLLQACNETELYTGLDQRQANEIVATLMRHDIPAERIAGEQGGMTVAVQESRFADAMAILDQSGLPKREFSTLGDIFKSDGLVSSPVEERARMIHGLSQELSSTISDIDGVLSARVHLVLPENDPLRQELIPSSASVFIRHRDTVAMRDLIPQIKMLVANGIAGLSYDNVSVILVPVEAPAADSGSGGGFVTFMGLWLHAESLTRAMWLVYGLAAAVIALAGALGYAIWRQRRRVYILDPSVPVKMP